MVDATCLHGAAAALKSRLHHESGTGRRSAVARRYRHGTAGDIALADPGAFRDRAAVAACGRIPHPASQRITNALMILLIFRTAADRPAAGCPKGAIART